MIRLLYFSTARASLVPSDVDEIVNEAQLHNKMHGITGALAYNGRNFCQLLEGKEPAVRALIENIKKDDRHSGFKIIDEKQIDTRAFPDWSLLRVEDLDFSSVINAMQD
tara:strand:- start:357 stop:683 length:327 start_codon:yes stop_codon:yes gene_type:complete